MKLYGDFSSWFISVSNTVRILSTRFPENLVKLIRSSGVLPEQIGELQRIAERIDLILSLPDPRSHIGLVLLPAVAVRSFVECVCVWINVDAHKLAADQSCDQVSQFGSFCAGTRYGRSCATESRSHMAGYLR